MPAQMCIRDRSVRNDTKELTADDDHDVTAQVDITVTALTLDADGRVTGAVADVACLLYTSQLSTDRVLAPDHVIAVDDNKGIIAGEGLGSIYGMAQTQRLLLAHKEDVCHVGNAQTFLQSLFLAGLCQLFFQLGAAVKVILNDALVAAQNDQNVRDEMCIRDRYRCELLYAKLETNRDNNSRRCD